MSIRLKLLCSYLILIIFSTSLLGYLVERKSNDAVFQEVTEKSKRITELIVSSVSVRNDLLSEKVLSDLYFAEKQLNSFGNLKIDNAHKVKVEGFDLPTLYAGKNKLTLDTKLVDEIKDSTGAVASIFVLNDNKLVRVSTNLFKDNQRTVGTYITSNSNIYKHIINKKEYSDKVPFNDEIYIARYKPLFDKDGNVIGAIALGYKYLNNYLEKTLSDIKIGKTGYVYIMDSKGNVILHPKIKGKNLAKYDFSKEIISKKNGLIEYKFNEVNKLAAYSYYEPWDWYIVSTANYDDLKSSSLSILYTTLVTGFVTLVLGFIVALFMSNIFVKPINKLKKCMEIAAKGDLTVRSDINTNDEIGVLSNSFNTMISENSRLVEEIVQYDILKTEFVANMSHELRTPLNIIFSTVQLFSSYINKNDIIYDTKKLDSYTNTMKQNCYRLLRLVNNLMDITKIDSGYKKLSLKNHNIVEVVEDITLSTAEYVQGMSRTIVFDTDTEEKIIAFDEESMERIILNLISNATKFTKPGDTIEVNLYDKEDHIIISVKDNGIGIPEEKQAEIFERFKQADSLMSRRHEGSGIGLCLVKSLVEMHDGKISVKSNCNQGTEFIINLPVKVISGENNGDNDKDYICKTNIEKIQTEFSDIYT